MSENSPKPPKRVTLEDLLKLKRHERPDPAYWERFERELHEKTLRTLVRSTPATPSTLWGWVTRWHPALPLASAAAFVLLLAFNHNLPTLGENTPVWSQSEAEASDYELVALASSFEPAPASAHTQISGAPSFVVSAISARADNDTDARYTKVAASKVLTPVHRPEVQFVSGSMATPFGTSLPGTVGSVGIY